MTERYTRAGQMIWTNVWRRTIPGKAQNIRRHGGVADIILVAGGYCLCEYFIYGAGAFASVPANLGQGIGGLILSAVLYPILIAIPDVKQTALANS